MDNPTCPRCFRRLYDSGKKAEATVLMAKRSNKKTGSEFWGCPNYPECNYTRVVTSTQKFNSYGGDMDSEDNDQYFSMQ